MYLFLLGFVDIIAGSAASKKHARIDETPEPLPGPLFATLSNLMQTFSLQQQQFAEKQAKLQQQHSENLAKQQEQFLLHMQTVASRNPTTHTETTIPNAQVLNAPNGQSQGPYALPSSAHIALSSPSVPTPPSSAGTDPGAYATFVLSNLAGVHLLGRKFT